MIISELLETLTKRNIKLQVIDSKLKVFDVDGNLDNVLMKVLKAHKPELLSIFSQRKRFTPSDFPFADLNQSQLDDIEQRYREVENIYPAVPMQQGMLFHGYMDGTGQSYTSQNVYELRGKLDVASFQQAWAIVAERHAIFRTCFVGFETQTIHQLVLSDVSIPFHEQDWSHHSDSEIELKLAEFKKADKAAGFDFAVAPLMRLNKINLSDGRCYLVWTHHHSLLDGWCIDIVFNEVMQYYDSVVHNTPLSLPTAAPYQDYIKWFLAQDRVQAREYWQNYLSGFVEPTPLVIGRDIELAEGEEKIGRFYFNLDAHVSQKLAELAGESGFTMNTVFQAAWSLLLACYSGEQDIVFGATVSGRPGEVNGIESMLGLFINTLPVRVDFGKVGDVKALMTYLTTSYAECDRHGFYPLHEIQRESDINKGQALFDSLVIYSNFPRQESVTDELQAAKDLTLLSRKSDEYTNYGLTFSVNYTDTLDLRITYSKEKFNEQVLGNLSAHLCNIMTSMSEGFQQPLKALQLLDNDQLGILGNQLAGVQNQIQPQAQLHRLFEAQSARRPEDVAVRYNNTELTYEQLNVKANQQANLMIELGVKPGDKVGLCLERSTDWAISIFAVLKTGAVYVAIDRLYPQNRQQNIIHDANLVMLLVHSDLSMLPGLRGVDTIVIDHPVTVEKLETMAQENLENIWGEHDSVAYVVFTSGSSGQAKGVEVSHGSICQYVNIFAEQLTDLNLPVDTDWLWHVTYTFDASLKAIAALCLGRTVTIANEDQCIDQFALLGLLRKHNIRVFNGMPMLVKMVMEAFEEDDQFNLIISGDVISPELYQQVCDYVSKTGLQAINAYGPTELTVNASYSLINCDLHNSTIGKVVSGSHSVVLSPFGNVLPADIPGELCVTGASVCNGYLNNPLNNEMAFVNVILGGKTHRYYKTGDRVTQSEELELSFIGRKDNQVKVRGFRIELGEIQTGLQSLADVEQAYVMTKNDGLDNKVLVAYITLNMPCTAEQKRDKVEELLYLLGKCVPDYMVPMHLVLLDVLPMTSAGKVDKGALPDPLDSLFLEDKDVAKTELEIALTEIWKDVLKQDNLSVNDNFFAVGGDSIMSMQVMAKAKRRGILFSARQLLLGRTIRGLATLVEFEHIEKIQQIASEGMQTLMPIQQRFFDIDSEHVEHFNQSLLFTVPCGFDMAMMTNVMAAIVERQDVLRLQFFNENGQWYGKYFSMDNDELQQRLSSEDLSNVDENELDTVLWDRGTAIQGSLDILQGVLFKVVHFNLGDTSPGRIMFCFHHLVIDGVSWHILLQDLEQAMTDASANKSIMLEDKTCSYQKWAEYLKNRVAEGYFDKDRAYWMAQFKPCNQLLPNDKSTISEPEQGHYGTAGFVLNENNSAALIRLAGGSTGIGLEDLLLSALFTGIRDWSGLSLLQVDLESHGRESLEGAPDISETIGWFTSIYPLCIDAETAGVVEMLGLVKAQRAAIPNKGLGFGVLKYMATDIETRNHFQGRSANVLFNFMGQVDALATKQDGMFTIATEAVGVQADLKRKSAYQISVNAQILAGEIHVILTFSYYEYHHGSMKKLTALIQTAIEQLINIDVVEQSTAVLNTINMADQDNVLVPLNVSSAVRNLFCLHPVGGYANHYNVLGQGLAASCQVFGLQAPDIFSDYQTDCVETLASYYIRLIKQQQPSGPYSLMGWSAGGRLAYEIACQLDEAGEKIDFIGILDQSPILTASQTSEARFEKLEKFFGDQLVIDWDLLDQMSESQAVVTLSEQVQEQGLRHDGLSTAEIENYIRFLITFPQAMGKLIARPSGLNIDLFKTMDETEGSLYDLNQCYNWDSVTDGQINVYQVAGNHANMVERPYVDSLIDIMLPLLDKGI